MRSNKLFKTISGLLIFFSFAIFACFIFIIKDNILNSPNAITQILIFTSILELIVYYFSSEYKSVLHINNITFALFRILLGILYDIGLFSINDFCIFWGVFEVVKALINIVKNIYIVYRHHEYLRLVETIASIVELVFGLLLAIHGLEHLNVHLLVESIILLVTGLILFIDTYLSVKENEIRH